ncbi:hypothetical protein E3O55_10165 [Cryobacterium sp. MDB1-18-2]|uniref:hypothetical protein n=1 Tax=unclassified Cryobacterium TaxID=2649013 RepID=UPI00106DA3A6|nr:MULTISPECIES: hypothetical protein [unclassified Cryobacterium]TFC28633.1 hypothetical protein E3O55_10165 [Cryobacterium sp. MDB1-18-2]TFC36820.1 hypothetical protein E3O50_18740 [Cryobacterium sp. MDB1-18-1]
MRRISFSGASFLTADRIADALVSLLAVLNKKNRSAVGLIPVVLVNGAVVTATLFLGPAHALIAIPEESLWPEPDASDTIRQLKLLGQVAPAEQSGFSETIAIPDYGWSDRDWPDFW